MVHSKGYGLRNLKGCGLTQKLQVFSRPHLFLYKPNNYDHKKIKNKKNKKKKPPERERERLQHIGVLNISHFNGLMVRGLSSKLLIVIQHFSSLYFLFSFYYDSSC